MKKLWITDHEYVSFSDKEPSFVQEIASRKRSIDFFGLGMFLPDPDPILRKQGKDLKIYRELLADPHVWACVQSRKAGVLSLEWDIDRGKAKSRQAKVIRDVFKRLDLYRIISEILDCTLFGFQPLEVIWESSGDYILPREVVGKPPEWFVFGMENELRFRSRDNYIAGEDLPDRKFLLAQYNASYQNPYGERTLSRCFWPVTFKKGGLKFWVIFNSGEKPEFMMWEEEDVDLNLANRDKTLTEAGVELTPKYFQKAYGFDEEDIAGVGGKPAEFAERSDKTDTVDQFTDRLLDEAPHDQFIDTIKDLLENVSSLEEFRDKLIETYKDLDSVQLGEVIARALAAAELAGRFEVNA